MAGYDATDALDDLFGNNSYASGAGAAVASRTEAILDGPTPADSINAVLRLAEGLPHLADVREVAEDDISELTETEQQQKTQTEDVIRTALAAGDAALWVIALGLDRAAKGKWWRRTHTSLSAYVENLLGRSAVYARQLRNHAPLALETAKKTGTVPKPGHLKETSRTAAQHGRDAAITLYEVVRDISAELGERPTAASLRAVHEDLPSQLPATPDQQRAVIEQTTRRTLGVETAPFDSDSNKSAAIAAPSFESGSNADGSTEAPDTATGSSPTTNSDTTGTDDDEIEDAEIVPEHLVTLQDAMKKLTALNKAITKNVFAQAAAEPDDRQEYLKVRSAIIKTATALRNKALHAPKE